MAQVASPYFRCLSSNSPLCSRSGVYPGVSRLPATYGGWISSQPSFVCRSAADATLGSAAELGLSASTKEQRRKELAEQMALFMPRRKVQPFVQLDHVQRRRDKTVAEIADAGKRVGLTKDQVTTNISALESLLPDLAPNLDRMKASDWVLLIKDPKRVANVLILLKSYYPSANLAKIVNRNPKILLKDLATLQSDAQQVRTMLGERLSNVDAVIEECPDLVNPAQVALTISNLKRWFPGQDPFELLQKNPALLNNTEESDLVADPTYGYFTVSG